MNDPATSDSGISQVPLKGLLVLCVLSGALVGLGQAPFGLWPIAILGLSGSAWLFRLGKTAWQAFLLGWATGVGYFGLTLHWIVEPFLVDIARHGWMAPFALIFMATGMALFWGGAAWLAYRLSGKSLLGWAAALAAFEMSRAFVLTGFPWALVGYIWTDSYARGLASVIGSHGLTLLTLLVAAAFVALQRKGANLALIGGTLGMLALGYVLLPAQREPDPDRPLVRVVQPNAPQRQKWDPEFRDMFVSRQIEFTGAPAAQTSETEGEASRPDLVVWPEAAIPYRLSSAGPLLADIAEAGGGATVVLGITRREGVRAFNSLISLTPDGLDAVYDKARLVPFGEYVPFGFLARRLGLRGLAAEDGFGYSAGPGAALISLPGVGLALPLICYEAIFPHLLRTETRPEVLLQITNDAWFGEFSGPYQHLAQARMRAVEQGLPMVRSANTGISVVTDAAGRIVAELPLGEAGFIDARLPEPAAATLYSRLGDVPAGAAILGLLAVATLRSRRKTV